VPAAVEVTVQADRTGRWEKKDCEQASHKRQTGHSRGVWDDDKTEAKPRCY